MGSQSSKDAARREAEERRLKESKPLRPQPANCFLSPHYTYPHACRSMCYRSEQLEMTPGEVAEIKCLVAAATPVDNAAIASPNTIQADLDALVESDEPLKIIIDTVSTVRRLPPPSARQRASTTVWPAITPTSCAPHHPSLPPYSFLAPPVSASSHPRSRMRSPHIPALQGPLPRRHRLPWHHPEFCVLLGGRHPVASPLLSVPRRHALERTLVPISDEHRQHVLSFQRRDDLAGKDLVRGGEEGKGTRAGGALSITSIIPVVH